MRPRLYSLVGLAVSVVACTSDVACPRGAAENDAGYCVDLPTDSSVSAATDDDARPPRDPDASQIDAGYEADGSAYNDAADQARDAGEVANDAGDPATSRDARPVGLDGSSDDTASPTVDAGPSCVPSAEVCNGKDDDCDALVDEEVSDPQLGAGCSAGLGACKSTGKQVCRGGALVCDAVAGQSTAEVCDNIDNDCDGTADDAPTDAMFGAPCSGGQGACNVPGTYVCSSGKLACSAPVMPTAEICDDVDNDCKNGVDDTFPTKGTTCTVGQGDCQGTGVWECDPSNSAKVRCTAVEKPKNLCGTSCGPLPAETCGDGIDNDCKNGVDDGCAPPVVNWYMDCDGDGFANSIDGAAQAATAPAPAAGCLGWTTLKPDEATHTNWDCSDSGKYATESALYHPGADFSKPENWVSSWDFNCDGVNTLGPKGRTRPAECPAALIDYYNINGNCVGQAGDVGTCVTYIASGKMTNVPPSTCPDMPVLVAGPSLVDPWVTDYTVCTVGMADATRSRYTCK